MKKINLLIQEEGSGLLFSGVNYVLSLALLADRVHLESDDCLHVYFMRLWFS